MTRSTRTVTVETEADRALAYWQTSHFQTTTLPPRHEQPHRWTIAEYIAAITPTPSSVLEFGCSSARNLAVLRQYLPHADLAGIDANHVTITAAKTVYGADTPCDLELHEGTHELLSQFVDRAFDVVFTCSVLDHIPAPLWRAVYDELVRVANVAVVMVEPVIGAGSLDLRNESYSPSRLEEADVASLGIAAPPYSYVHDYCGHDSSVRVVKPLPMGVASTAQWREFGNLYTMLERRIEPTIAEP